MSKAPSTGKPVHGKTPAQVLKASTSAAPTAKDQDKDGKKDVENLKDANLEEAPEDKNKEIKYEAEDGIGYNLGESQDSLVAAPEGKPKGTNMATEWEKSGLKAMNLASAPGKAEGDADYAIEYPDPKASKSPEISKLNPNLASAPGTGKSKMDEASDLSKTNQELAEAPGGSNEADYKIKINIPGASSPEIDNLATSNLVVAPEKGSKVPTKDSTDPNFATSPGKEEGDAGYEVEYLNVKSSKSADIDNLDTANLAEIPAKNTQAQIDIEVNSEMGYNLTEGFERPSPELKKN
jgi:hypothetical protein